MRARKVRRIPLQASAKLRRALIKALVVCFVMAGCKHAATPGNDHPQSSTNSVARPSTTGNIDMFDLKMHPDATIIHPIDPHTLSESQVKFGIAPKRDPSVEYQPDIILMENGDKAIKSVASDGITWTFDANAPQVSDFQEGKIVFATGRAVGRVLGLKRQGDSVSVILGPIQLTDVIRNGNFAMNQNVDLNNMISYVAPDYPQPPDPDQPKTTSMRQTSPDHADVRMVLSRVLRGGKWTPTNMVRTFADGHRASYYKTGRHWKATTVRAERLANGTGMSLGGATLVRTSGQSLQMPGVPGVGGIQPLKVPLQPFTPPSTLGQLPMVDLKGGRAIPMAGSDGGIGVEYDYDKNGIKLRAAGYVTIRDSGIEFFLHIKNGIQDCGVRLKGNVGVNLHVNASAKEDFRTNLHATALLPIDLSIPLGGPVPLSLTFTSSFSISTGFSARTSVLNAVGEYSFGGGVEAGYWANKWQVNVASHLKTNTDLGDSAEGLSVGINSVVMSFDVRTMIGIGAFGFNTGVYAALRFSGTALKSPNIGIDCRQGTIEIYLDAGVGYSIPGWAVDAINFFIAPFTDKRVERRGSFFHADPQLLFQNNTQIPERCATPKGGG